MTTAHATTAAHVTEPAAAEGKYLYAIIAAPAPERFAAPGIGGRGDVVHTLAMGPLAAVVSDTPHVEYDSNRRNMLAHTKVLEEVMAQRTVLPVCFGSVATDVEAITRKVLMDRRDELTTQLGLMRDRVELGLKVSWRDNVVFEEVLNENPAIRRLRDALVGQSPDKSHFERMRLGEQIGQAMERKRFADEQRVMDRVRPFVHSSKILKPVGDRMVFNGAFLVEAAREADLDACVRAMDEEWSDRLTFKYVGPVPPYNFVSLKIHW